MSTQSIIEYLKISAAVVAVAFSMFLLYSIVGYVSNASPFADAALDCSTCISHWIDGPGGFFNEPFPYTGGYTEPGGGGGGGDFIPPSPPPPAPVCTLDLTAEKLTWTTQNAYQVLIVPLTNSPQIPGLVPGGSPTSVVHSEGDAFNSPAVLADIQGDGIPFTSTYTGTAFAGDQATMNRLCVLIDGPGATATTFYAEGFNSPSGNYVVKWGGSSWAKISATQFNSHLRYNFTCAKPGSLETYPLNGSHMFVPPLGVGTHTYKLTANGSGGTVMCEDTVTINPPPQKGCIQVLKETFNPQGQPLTPVAQFTFKLDGTTTAQNDASGNALFSNVEPGTHQVTEVVPQGWTQLSVTPQSGTVVVAPGPTCAAVVFKNKQVLTPPPPEGECKLKITKSVDKTSAVPGDYLEYTLDFKNIGDKKCTGSGVMVVDSLDPGVSYKSETHSSNVTPGYLSDPVYKASDHTVRFNAWDLDPNETGWAKIKVKVETPSQCASIVKNKAKISSYEYNNFSTFVHSNEVTITVQKDCPPPPPPPTKECTLSIQKSASVTQVAPGGYVEFTLTFKNIGQKDCTGGGVHITDVLDPLLTYKSETHSANVVPGYQSDPVYKSSTRTIHFNANTLIPGEEGWVKIKVKAEEPSSCSVDVENKANITAYEYDNFTTFETSNTVVVTIAKDCTPPALPTCTLSANPYQIYSGGSSTLSWTTTNATTASIDKGVGTVSPVASGSKSVSPTATTLYTLTATGPGGSVQCTAKVKVVPPPTKCELEIVKSVNKTHAAPNDEVEYAIEFKNVGGQKCTGSGVKVIDVVDPRLTYKSETHSSGVTAGYLSEPVYKSSDRTLRWNAWDLDPGETGWVKWKAKVGTPEACSETIPNKAKITAEEINWQYVESNTVNVTVSKDCNVPVPYCTMSVAPLSIESGSSATLSWNSTNVTSVTIDQGVGVVALSGDKSVSPTVTTTYKGTFTGTGGTVTCEAAVSVHTPDPVPQCTLTVSAPKIKTGESVIVSWSSQNVTQGFVNAVGTTTPVSGGSAEVFPADTSTFTGTFTGAYGSVSCSAPVTVEKGGGGCQGNCGGGLNQPNVVMLQKPPEAPLAFVTLEQIPYTGFEAGKALTLIFWLAVGVLAALLTYFVMGRGGVTYVLGGTIGTVGFSERGYGESRPAPRPVPTTLNEPILPRSDSAAYNGNGNYLASGGAYTSTALIPHVMPMPAAKPAVDGIPDLSDVIEGRAHGAGVLMSPEAVAMAMKLSTDRGETLRIFGEILNETVRTLPREDGWIMLTSERFDELSGKVPRPATVATPTSTPSVEDILASVMQSPAPEMRVTQNIEMPMTDSDDQAVVVGLARAILSGNRDQAYTVVRNLESARANVASVMTVVAGALDQLYRARRHGLTTDLSVPAMQVTDEALAKMVEIFTHGMDAGYANPFTGLKLAVAQSFEARG